MGLLDNMLKRVGHGLDTTVCGFRRHPTDDKGTIKAVKEAIGMSLKGSVSETLGLQTTDRSRTLSENYCLLRTLQIGSSQTYKVTPETAAKMQKLENKSLQNAEAAAQAQQKK